jgi:HK97 family phage major capsid protein
MSYLDRLHAQFDEITAGITTVLERAEAEDRDVTDEEQKLVDRDQARAEDLKKSIEHYSAIEVTRSKVLETRGKVPAAQQQRTTTGHAKDEAKLTDLFPTAGAYIVTVARAMRGDTAAGEQIERAQEILERATEHQTTADNPGLIPRPILGPVIQLIDQSRPLIQSISTRPLPAGQFDRPKITQHVAVGKQTAEKALTESRKMIIGKLPVAAATYAGHVNVSRQDIKWSQPGIMDILAQDFALQYALETDADAATQFLASLTGTPETVPDWEAASIRAALFAAAAGPIQAGQGAAVPDTFWMSVDVWAQLGGLVNDMTGVPVFPGLNPGNANAGDIAGFKPVVDPWFPPGTAVIGKGALSEWYEDIDGLLQVAEPDVLGQLVGYAGYGAFVNTEPTAYTVLEMAPIVPLTASRSTKTSDKK